MAGSTFKDPNIGPTGVAVPAEAGQMGGPDSAGLLRAPRLYDTDTGGGTENTLGVVLRASAGGGSVEAGTAANPLRVDPTGTTPQTVAQGAGAGAGAPWTVRLSDGAAFYQAPTTAQIPATLGQKLMAASLAVVLASDQSAIPVSTATSSVAGQSSVAGAAVSTTLLAANAARKGATIFNDSGAVLFVKLGAVASASSFTARLVPNAYYEVPFAWVGVIDGIWSEAVGNARITELS